MRRLEGGQTPAKRKKPSEEAISSALSILDRMSQSGARVHAMVIINPMILTFDSTIEKQEDRYALVKSDLTIGVEPKLCDLIMSSPEGGLLLARKEVMVLLDEEERSTEELLKLWPSVSRLVH